MMLHAFRIIFTLVAVIDVSVQNLTLRTIWNSKMRRALGGSQSQ